MIIGKLRHRITIERNVVGRDPIGQPANTWVKVADVWADVRFPSGMEYIAADKQLSETVASMKIRRREVDTAMRIIYDGGIYHITAVLPDGTRYINLATKKVK